MVSHFVFVHYRDIHRAAPAAKTTSNTGTFYSLDFENPEKIKNKKILLVDDVFTTGATVNECSRILLKNKAADVEIFTFARAIDRQ